MDRHEVISQFEAINVWKRGDQRAPHKPLLVLLALGDWSRSKRRAIPYSEIDENLTHLLKEFGPPRESFHPEYPFSRLQNDGLWVVASDEGVIEHPRGSDAKKSILLEQNARGAFPDEIYDHLENDPELINELAQTVLDAHFPETMHQDIRQTVGLEFRYSMRTESLRTRDPNFRYRVLTAYEQKCALCGYCVRIGSTLIGIEAAHIKWFQAGGPDDTDNGLALCSLHHKLLDRGAFTLSFDRTVLVSELAHGASGFDDWLLQYSGRPINEPVNTNYQLRDKFIDWHHREVFQGPARP